MTQAAEYLWYIPNQVSAGHRGDVADPTVNPLDTLTAQARALEQHGWTGALLGTGWGRPDCLTVGTALVARTDSFEPLVAIRPGYWTPAHFASAAATLDRLGGGRLRINIVSGKDAHEAYGDGEGDQASRYARTKEFMHLVRRLWTEENVTHHGDFYRVAASTVEPRIEARGSRHHPPLYFGGASPAAEAVAATEADVQLFWGEPRDALRDRIARLRTLSDTLGRTLSPLEFGLRITTVIRDTTAEAWAAAEAKVDQLAAASGEGWHDHKRVVANGQQRLLDLQKQGEVLDENLYTTPGKFGAGGAATTWLVGSAEDVATSLQKYRDLGISRFILSDTPYLDEIGRQGRDLLPLLRH